MVWHLKIGSKLRVLWAKTIWIGPKMQKIGALNLKIYLIESYFYVNLDRHYLFLRPKSKSKKLFRHWLCFHPVNKKRLPQYFIKEEIRQNCNVSSSGYYIQRFPNILYIYLSFSMILNVKNDFSTMLFIIFQTWELTTQYKFRTE